MDQVWDPRGEADAALDRVVQGFGPQVLGRPDMLEGLLFDNMPEQARSVKMLVEAARCGVAELLDERVRQGVSPQAAVSMAAAEMISRTAVDVSGAPWAVAAFARVLGYQAPQPPPATPTKPVTFPTTPEPVTYVPPRDATSGGQDTLRPPVRGFPDPDGDTILPAPGPRPTVLTGRAAATAAVAAAAVAAPMQLLWCADASARGVLEGAFAPADFWVSAVFLMAGLAVVAIGCARGQQHGATFAAVLGIAGPTVAVAILFTALAAQLTILPGILRQLLLLISVIWLVAALIATVASIAGLARWDQLARNKPAALPALLAAAGVCYALANILAQGQDRGILLFNALGPGVRGWSILWGILFVVLVAVPPLLAAFLLPGSSAQLAALTGWLLFALSNQLAVSPIEGVRAKPGLYLTWLLWIAMLAGTLVMAARRSASTAGAPGRYSTGPTA